MMSGKNKNNKRLPLLLLRTTGDGDSVATGITNDNVVQ
jgi:hypothetical protein